MVRVSAIVCRKCNRVWTMYGCIRRREDRERVTGKWWVVEGMVGGIGSGNTTHTHAERPAGIDRVIK